MIKEPIKLIEQVALSIGSVRTFKYQDKILNNAQPNNLNYQVTVETDGYFQSINEAMTLSLNMSVMSFVKEDELSVQDKAMQIGLNIIYKLIDEGLSIKDYTVLLFTKYTDDSCSGARFTLNIVLPLNFCPVDDSEDEVLIPTIKLNI